MFKLITSCETMGSLLWSLYWWERRVTRLEVEVDSEIVVGFLQKGICDTHPLSFLVRLCYGFISRDWIVRIVHVYREANRLADGLANYVFTLPLGFHFFDSVPGVVEPLIGDDVGVGLHFLDRFGFNFF